MDRKMFFLDLDGTTLRDDKTIPEENVTAIREAVDAGHYVAIATGRSTVSAVPVAQRLGMLRRGCFLISFNGAKILSLKNREQLRALTLSAADAAFLFAGAEQYGIHAQAYGGDEILARREDPELFFYVDQSKMNYRIVPKLYESTADASFTTPKVLLASLTDKVLLERFREDHREWESGRCVSFFSAPEYLEYCPLGGTKADGIRFFEEYLGIAHENTIAMGDEENDLAMIRAAGVGVAMPNAVETIRKSADFVPVNDNNTGGVAEAIRRYMV